MAVMAPKKKKPAREGAENPWPKLLRDIRARLDISQKEAGKRVGVSRRSWAAWEIGETIPSPSRQILIRLLFRK